MKKLLLLLFYFLFFCNFASAGKGFSDDFSGDLSQWELINGSMDYWLVQDEAVYATVSQSRKLSTIVPTDEAWQDMKEYSVDFIFKVFDSTDKNFVIGMRDASNFYDFHFYGSKLIVEDIRNGYSIHSTSVTFPLELNRDYEMHLNYSQEKIEFLIDGELVFMTNDAWAPAIYGGKFGLKIATGSVAHSRAFFDQIEVKELDQKDVLFMQDDDLWADEIYDHGEEWTSSPGIENWGCALSSVAMLLRAYGYHYLPGGEEINPLTLNNWLKTQSDGYVGNGLLNWLAISRLSSLLSIEDGGLPKLEFSFFGGEQEEVLDFLRENLADRAGQIASSGSHFFLVVDYLEDLHDFLLKDPLFGEMLLSDKSDDILSLRIFTPSFTDLSYLLLVVPRDLEFSIVDEDSEAIEGFMALDDLIVSGAGSVGEDHQLLYYPKPSDGQFNFFFDANLELLAKSQLFVYQIDGEVAVHNFGELFISDDDSKQFLFSLDYQKYNESEFAIDSIVKTEDEKKLEKLNEVANEAEMDFNDGNLSFYLFYQLNLLIDSLRNHLDYFFLLDEFLEFHRL